MEWIYFVIIFFYILSAISKATKKKQQEEQKAAAVRQMNRRVEARPAPPVEEAGAFTKAAEAVTDLPLGDVMRFINQRMEQRKLETVDYDLTSQFEATTVKEQAQIEREHSTVSHFHEAKGLTTSLHDRSGMATTPTFSAPVFSFPSRRAALRTLAIKKADLKTYLIMSEVLGKPRALRGR